MRKAHFLKKAEEEVWTKKDVGHLTWWGQQYDLKSYDLSGRNVAVLVRQNQDDDNLIPYYDYGNIILVWEDANEDKIYSRTLGIPGEDHRLLIKNVVLEERADENAIYIFVEVENDNTNEAGAEAIANIGLPCVFGYKAPISCLHLK